MSLELKEIIRYATGSLMETGRAEIDEMWVTSSRVLPDGRILAASNTDGKVQLWEMSGPGLESKKMLLEASRSSPTAISPDGKWLIFYTSEGLQAKNVETGQDGIFLHDKWYGHLKLSFSPDGKLLAVSRSDRSVRIFDFVTGNVSNGVGGPEDWISQMAFNKDSNLLVGAAGGSAWIWSVVPGLDPLKFKFYESIQEGDLVRFDNTVTAVTLNPDSKLLAVATSENSIWLYDRISKQVVGKLTGHFSAPIELAFSPDGSYLASIDRDGVLIVWEIARQVVAGQVRPETGVVRGLVVRPDGNLMAWGEHTIWLLDQISAEAQRIAGLAGGLIIGVSGESNLAATYLPYQVSLYNTNTGEFLQTLVEEAAEPFSEYYWEGQIFRRVNNAVFSRDGSRLATVGSGGVWVYNLPDMKLQHHFEGTWSVKAAISRDGGWLVASTFEKIRPPELFNLETGESI